MVIQYRLTQVELRHPPVTILDNSIPYELAHFILTSASPALCHFCCLQRLQELHLQENSIELLAEQALSGLSSLALLDLSRNHLRTLGASSLKPLVSLQVLRVTGG